MATRAERAEARAAVAAQLRIDATIKEERKAICAYLVTRPPETERVYAGEDVLEKIDGEANEELYFGEGEGETAGLMTETIEWEAHLGNTSTNFYFARRRTEAAAHMSALREWGVSPAFPLFVNVCKHVDTSRDLLQITELKETIPYETLADSLAVHKDDGLALMTAFKYAACQVLLALEVAQYRIGLEYDELSTWHVRVGHYAFSDHTTTHAQFERPGNVTFYMPSYYFSANRMMLCVADAVRTRCPKKRLENAAKRDFSESFSKCVKDFFTDAYQHPENPYDQAAQPELYNAFKTSVLSKKSISYIARNSVQKYCLADPATREIIEAGASGKYCPSQMLNMPYFAEFLHLPQNARPFVVGDSEAH